MFKHMFATENYSLDVLIRKEYASSRRLYLFRGGINSTKMKLKITLSTTTLEASDSREMCRWQDKRS
jgi:hypothetical protein